MAHVRQSSTLSGNTSKRTSYKIRKNESSSIVMPISNRSVRRRRYWPAECSLPSRSSIVHGFDSLIFPADWTNWFFHPSRSWSITHFGKVVSRFEHRSRVNLRCLQSRHRSEETCLLWHWCRSGRSRPWFDADLSLSSKHSWAGRTRRQSKSDTHWRWTSSRLVTFQILQLIDSINQLKQSREFYLSFADDPQGFICKWLASQSRDLKMITDSSTGNNEEERRADYYTEQWSYEAVSRYFYNKVQQKRVELEQALGIRNSWVAELFFSFFVNTYLCVDVVQGNLNQSNSLRLLLTDGLSFFSSALRTSNTFQSGSFHHETCASSESEGTDHTFQTQSNVRTIGNRYRQEYWKQIQVDSNQSEENREQ